MKLQETNPLSILSSQDFQTASGGTLRVFTVLGPKVDVAKNKHRLKVHTKHGSTDLAVFSEAGRLFGALGHVEHVAPLHHREWKVWVAVK